ncbi:MAG: hypothetical protein IJI54_13115 [Kiritimatiellae bacterium]|nr:hypothetical protein [Kiritimatiellia bacterium]MBQ6142211.1 hypothetical protein [Kiritimatiellia bacterium]
MRQTRQAKRKHKFKVYVAATVGTCIEVMAEDLGDAKTIAQERWETGKGGAIDYEAMEATDVYFSAYKEGSV